MIRLVVLIIGLAAVAPAPLAAWVDSVEFPWNAYPRQLWERELVWLKNIGIRHVSLPRGSSDSDLMDAIRMVRRLNLEADLEGPIPDSMATFTRAHGGPLDQLPRGVIRVSALDVNAMTEARAGLGGGAPGIVWTNVHDTIDPQGYHAGALTFSDEETAGTSPVRRTAQLSSYWGQVFSTLHETPGAGARVTPEPAGLRVRQFVAANGSSLVSVVNVSAQPWTGDLRVLYPVLKRVIAVPNVRVEGHDSLWLPVNVPLSAGPLCRDCSAFAAVDHLVYATAEMTTLEYENGVLAMEFSGSSGGEVVLQLSRQPSGPFLAGGKPLEFDWDERSMRVRLQIPAGAGRDKHVRIGLAIEPPDATAFFTNARVLMIGEANRLPAEFSSKNVADRSRLQMAPEFPFEVEPAKEQEPLSLIYDIKVPDTALDGDHADLALEADGVRMSHANPRLLRPVTISLPDAIDVRLADHSALPLFPPAVAMNQRADRDVTVRIENHAPEIRNFHMEISGAGLEFSPSSMDVSVGASLSRDFSFHVFLRGAAAGVHSGAIRISGAAAAEQPVQFVLVPPAGEVAYQVNGFSFLESAKARAVFMPGRWLELTDKDNARNLIGVGGREYASGPIEVRDGAMFAAGRRITLGDLETQTGAGKSQ